MNKYLIAGVKCMINFHHKEFFDSRLNSLPFSSTPGFQKITHGCPLIQVTIVPLSLFLNCF